MLEVLEAPPSASPENSDALYEIVYGEYREIEPMGARQVTVASALCTRLDAFGRQNNRGIAVTEMLFVLDAENRLQRRFDVAFVSYDRWPEAAVPDTNAWNVVPDVAVEVVSPTNFATEIDLRVAECLRADVRQVWVIYLETGNVYVFESADRCRILHRGGVLEGGEILPGFRLPVDELLSAVRKPE
jgi:Uma2 family endonuclease